MRGALALLFLGTRGTDAACLCVFDTDRTLTGRQGETRRCPRNAVQHSANDTAYGGGPLTLSAFTQSVAKTFCASCYLAIVSAGAAGGKDSEERRILHGTLSGSLDAKWLTRHWQEPGCTPVTAPLITSCGDGHKQSAVPGIVAFYERFTGETIEDADVHFFDDRRENVAPFRHTSYNAHQISCASRDVGGIGLCGATLEEIVTERGVTFCEDRVKSV